MMWGGCGVSLFLVLSGYLFSMHHADQKIEYGLYVKNKIAKFYPLHIITFMLAIPFVLHDGLEKANLIGIFNLLLIHAWVPNQMFYFSYNMVSWYLCLTLFFAIICPFFVWLTKKAFFQRNALIVIMLVVIFQYIWCALWIGRETMHWMVYICPLLRMLDFIVGMEIYFLISDKRIILLLKNYFVFAIFVGLCIILLGLSLIFNNEYFAVAVWTMPVTLSILFAVSEQNKWASYLLSIKPIIFLGNISFEFFLFHQLVLRYWSTISRSPIDKLGPFQYIFPFGLAIVISVCWKKFFIKVNRKK